MSAGPRIAARASHRCALREAGGWSHRPCRRAPPATMGGGRKKGGKADKGKVKAKSDTPKGSAAPSGAAGAPNPSAAEEMLESKEAVARLAAQAAHNPGKFRKTVKATRASGGHAALTAVLVAEAFANKVRGDAGHWSTRSGNTKGIACGRGRLFGAASVCEGADAKRREMHGRARVVGSAPPAPRRARGIGCASYV